MRGNAVLIGIALACWTLAASAQPLSGREIAQRVYDRDDGRHVQQALEMILVDRNGRTRRRQSVLIRKEFGDVDKTAIILRSPSDLRGTGFMVFDYHDQARDDDQWIYLPAMRRERRVSASKRGDNFLGTDFSYEDIKERTRLSLTDFDFSFVETKTVAGRDVHVIQALPVDGAVAKTLGYGKILATVDVDTWMYTHLTYFDVALNPLKETELRDVVDIDGILTATTIVCRNIKSGHSTTFRFSDVDYTTPVDDRRFTIAALRRGA